MKLLQFYRLVYCLLFSLMLLISCNRQNQSNFSKEEEAISPLDTNALSQDGKHAEQIGEYIVEIFEDSKGIMWFGTMAKGVARYDARGNNGVGQSKTLTYFTKADGLCGNTVLSIAEDKAGNLWFGTHTGASRYNGKTFTNFTETEGLHGAGCNILVDKNGNIWAGTNHGVFRYKDMLLPDGKGRFTEFEIPNPEIENLSYKWEAGKIWSLKEDSQGNIWFGRDGYGACKYDPASSGTSGESFTHFTKKDGLCSNNVCSIVEDKQGNIWFSSLTSDTPTKIKEGGVSRYNARQNNGVGQKAFTTFQELEGLHGNDVYTIAQDKSGNIWISAIGFGIYCYDSKNFKVYKEVDRKDLIYNFAMQSFLEDKNGTIWLGFSGGLFQIKGTSIVNITQADLSKNAKN